MESVDVSILLEMLGPDNVIILFSTILLERSVILVSRQLTGETGNLAYQSVVLLSLNRSNDTSDLFLAQVGALRKTMEASKLSLPSAFIALLLAGVLSFQETYH